MTDKREVEEPSPTVVGPQPCGRGTDRSLSVPQGLERLLTLAGMSPEWKEKVLADPLAAAREAGIELTESERSVLASTPRAALEQMAGSMMRRSRGMPWARIAGGTIACAAAAGLAGTCVLFATATGGIRPDLPRPKLTQPDDFCLDSLNEALSRAGREKRGLMAVFPHPDPFRMPRIRYEDGSHGPLAVSEEEQSQKVVLTDSMEFRAALRNAGLLAVRVTRPVANPVDHEKEREAYDKAIAAYEAALKNYGLEEEKLPAVVFLAPDGTELSKLVQFADEAKLIEAVRAVPPLLAKWVTDQRRREEPNPLSEGMRPDIPESKEAPPAKPAAGE